MIENAVQLGKENLFEQVYSKVLSDMTPTGQQLTLAIHELGDTNVNNTDIKKRLYWDTNKLSTNKAQLIHLGIIRKEGRGVVSIDLSYFGDFLDDYFD